MKEVRVMLRTNSQAIARLLSHWRSNRGEITQLNDNKRTYVTLWYA